MQKKSIDYAILYNEDNPPIDIFQELNRFPHEPPFHRTTILIGDSKSDLLPSSDNAQKINFYSFAGIVPLNVFMNIKKKVEVNFPNLDVHFVRNNETPIDFTLSTLDGAAIPTDLIKALGTFLTDHNELGEPMENQAYGKIPGTVFERVEKSLSQTHPNIRIKKTPKQDI